MTNIDSSAIVHPKAEIGEDVTIGPFSWIHENVKISDGCYIGAGVIILPGTSLGKSCRVYHHAVLGEIPQDLKFEGEITTVEIGDRTTIREFATINRGTTYAMKTVVGSDCLIMANAHVAHDCIVGDRVILTNSVALGGHVQIEDWVIVGGLSGIHQFIRIGQHSIIASCSKVTKDVPPYVTAGREPLIYEGLNLVGLKRRGFSSEAIQTIKQAYSVIYNSKFNISDAVKNLEETTGPSPELLNIIRFIKNSQRGIIR
ncbi:MAG: acyl-[acyl-carrier-protein]--UDP-N-acetylglucosamine O-acyltransferase [Candidatus Marinimicrobia bacterium CG08_land_8_20_14_0_20_45_22]|nr:MAG: acyl-[acyl-carrier-protein]--UDP-N-acetylglucosamine O-acyltransferase [Candidatus Marinimicrobia bacterium CG08_land_8_20_14_0_20_45_22]